MSLISVTCFGLAAALLFTVVRKGSDILSPGRIFGFIWLIAIGLADLKLSGLQHTWTTESWILVLLGPASFLLGIFLSTVVNLHTQLLPLATIRERLRSESIRDQRLFVLIVMLFLLYVAGYAIIAAAKGSVPLFSANPSRARMEFSMFGVGLLTHNMPLVIFFSAMYHVVVPGQRARKMVLKAISFVALLTYVFLLQRYQVIMVAVMCFTLLYYGTRAIRARTALFSVLGAFSFFFWIASLRAGRVVSYYLYSSSRMKFSPQFALATEPYMYLVMNLENLSRGVAKLEHFTYGYFTFDFILALTGLKHWLEEYFSIIESPFLISGYNTYTVFWTFYRDFGIIGLGLIPLLLGAGVGVLYYGLRLSPSLKRVGLYGVVIFVLILSFFLNPMGFLWFAYIVTMMFVVFRVTAVRHSVAPDPGAR
jgi:oligosaccharide repeat unit polymerase